MEMYDLDNGKTGECPFSQQEPFSIDDHTGPAAPASETRRLVSLVGISD
jgi:hypothetical protein